MERRYRVAMAAGAWMAGLALLSFLPTTEKRDLHTRGRLHTVGHLLLFLVAAMLVVRIARTAWVRFTLLCAVAVLGVLIEFLQHVASGAALEWHDVVVDLLGVALGGILLGAAGGMRGSDAFPEPQDR